MFCNVLSCVYILLRFGVFSVRNRKEGCDDFFFVTIWCVLCSKS